MDLSNLSSNLPATKSLEKISIIELNKDLTTEFKNAAKSVASLYNTSSLGTDLKTQKVEFANAAKAVASLYRLGTNASVLLRNKGYLDCLDDLLHMITNGDDIENWALTKRAEITNHREVPKESTAQEVQSQVSADFHLPSEYEFSLPLELASSIAFRPSFAPLSVSYKRPKKNLYKKLLVKTHDGSSGSSDYESDVTDSSDDVELKRRKVRQMHEVKRRKKDPSSDHD